MTEMCTKLLANPSYDMFVGYGLGIGNTYGGPGAGNLIAGSDTGIRLGEGGDVLQGNFIGTDVTGSTPYG